MHAILTPVEEAGAEFLERVAPVNGKTSLGVTRVKGKTLAWNQKTNDRAGSVTYVQGDVTTEYFQARIAGFVFGHKYFVHAKVQLEEGASIDIGFTAGAQYLLSSFVSNLSQSQIVKAIASYTNTQYSVIGVNFRLSSPSDGDSFSVSDCFICDLTLMFGAGNEPETVEEFEAMFPEAYYEYNPGELVNVAASGIKTVGFNQWDEEWELGEFVSSGEPKPSTSAIRTAHYIPVLPGKQLYFHNGGIDVFITVVFYDSERNIISVLFEGAGGVHDGSVVSCPTDAAYIKCGIAGAYGRFYKHDICINLSDPDRNGEYEPYKEDVVPLGLDSSKVKDSEGNILEIKGLASAGGTYDDKTSAKLTWRVGRIDLGSLNWTYYGEYFVAPNSFGAAHTTADIICPLYEPAVYSSQMTDKSVHIDSNGQIYIKDSSYTDAASFKAAMSGVMLNYKLATPIEYDLAEPRAWVAEREDGGTETIIQTGSSAPVILAPILDLKYGDYAEEIAPFLKSDLASAESVKAMLEAMKTAGVISAYTMTWNKSARRYDFTISQ